MVLTVKANAIRNNEGLEVSVKSVDGDLIKLALDGHFDVIIHGCNCFCAMDGGIARSIKQEFPEAFAADLATVEGGRAKLGEYSKAKIVRAQNEFTVVNAYTQFHFHGSGVLADYEAIRSAFSAVQTEFSGFRIGYPRIGAGLAGGDWGIISGIISEELEGEDHTLVRFKT